MGKQKREEEGDDSHRKMEGGRKSLKGLNK